MTMEPLALVPVRPVALTGASHLGETRQEPPARGFGEFLADALREVDGLQKKSDSLNAALAAGQIEDVSQVMVASQKAELALQLTLQLRNRALSAAQELLRMQV